MPSTINFSGHVVIVTHELFYGASQALRDYLNSKNTKQVLFISHPIHAQNPRSYVQKFIKGKFLYQKNKERRSRASIGGYFVDAFFTFVWVFFDNSKYDIYVGVDALNCLVGLLLRWLGRVKHVVFYSIDFTPARFSQAYLNSIYHYIESMCVMKSDERWNVSPRIAEGRERLLHISQTQYPQKVVPIGIWEHDIVRKIPHTWDRFRIVFLGHLLKKQGVQMILKSLPIVKKKIPKVSFLVIGGGEYEGALKKLTRDLKLTKEVRFMGWISDQVKIRRMLVSSALAVATYDPSGESEHNFSYYADPTKIKSYFSCGLPVIMTSVSYNAQELAKRKSAIIAEYSKESISQVLISILENTKMLNVFKSNAMTEAYRYTWEKIFSDITKLE